MDDHNQNTKHLLAITNESTPSSTDPSSTNTNLNLNTGNPTVKLDELGPMVVNTDGTLSRIANWNSMTEPERQRTLRVLSARNRLRLSNEEKKQQQELEAQAFKVAAADADAPDASSAAAAIASRSSDSDQPLSILIGATTAVSETTSGGTTE